MTKSNIKRSCYWFSLFKTFVNYIKLLLLLLNWI